MRLTNRTASFNNNPFMAELTETEIQHRLGGDDFNYVRHIPAAPVTLRKTGEGAFDYTVRSRVAVAKEEGIEVGTEHQPWLSYNPSGKILDEIRMAHLANIRKNLEQRIQAAKSRGDRTLINLLEAESAAIAVEA